jgi:hypothetical protein
VHPAVIETQLPILERLLARLLADPPKTTIRTRDARPLDFARKLDLQTVRWLIGRPALLSAVRGGGGTTGATTPRTIIDQPTSQISLDHPVTRYVALLLKRIKQRLIETARSLRSLGSGRRFLDPAADAHAVFLANQVDKAVVRIEALLRVPLFRKMRPSPLTDSALQALADHPLYGALHRVARRLLDPGLSYAWDGNIQSPLKRTYDLFEQVVLYRLATELPIALGDEWHLKKIVPVGTVGREDRPPDGSLWLMQGPDGLWLELRYQQRFSRAVLPPDTRKFSSLSGASIPDYIFLLRRADQPISWIILDAKYRSGRQAIDDGLGDVHRYRDALRIRGLVASKAFVIVPRMQEPELPYGQAEFHKAHQIGVLQIYKTDWLCPIVNWVAVNSI